MSRAGTILRWRRQPSEKGLALVCQGWRGYDLWRGEQRIASVRAIGVEFYWYGLGRNSTREQQFAYPTVDDAKSAAMNAAKDALLKMEC